LIPFRFDEVTSTAVITHGQIIGVGSGYVPKIRAMLRTPFPGGPENFGSKGFHAARRDVDQEASNLTRSHGLQVITNGVDVPPRNELSTRLQNLPGELYELSQTRF